ncbi:hypothetical protein [Roseobacter cerasinus]|nr:hypothetical protein [Roseobacter cerasinus]
MKQILLAAAFSITGICASAATLDITAKQVGSDVVFVGTGSLDFSENRPGRQEFGVVDGALVDRYTITDLFTSFTPLGNTRFDLESYSATETGDAFYINGPRPFTRNYLRVTRGYTSLDAFDFTWRAPDSILTDPDLNYGTLATFGNNTITLTGSPVAPVPLPASLAFLIAGLMAFLPLRKRVRAAHG